jgi:hypothetical protein
VMPEADPHHAEEGEHGGGFGAPGKAAPSHATAEAE